MYPILAPAKVKGRPELGRVDIKFCSDKHQMAEGWQETRAKEREAELLAEREKKRMEEEREAEREAKREAEEAKKKTDRERELKMYADASARSRANAIGDFWQNYGG